MNICRHKWTRLEKITGVERVENIDTFTNPKTGKTSNCYRITYRSMDRSLTDVEINALQDSLRDEAASALSVELR